MNEIDLAEARTLCTAAEWKLVEAAEKPAIDSHSATQLKQKIDRTRKLRDKWRDVYTSQRRATQEKQDARTTQKNARSRKKSQLFGQVLSRFLAQSKKVAAEKTATGERASGTGSKKTARPSKSARAVAHRKVRASTRAGLNRKVADANAVLPGTPQSSAQSTPRKSKSKPAETNDAAASDRPVAVSVLAGSTEAEPTKKAATSDSKQRGTAAKKAARVEANAASRGGVGRDRQIAVTGAANRARVKASGLDTRVRGHVSARTKRTQAKRDARN